jgi:hypothetical protein
MMRIFWKSMQVGFLSTITLAWLALIFAPELSPLFWETACFTSAAFFLQVTRIVLGELREMS